MQDLLKKVLRATNNRAFSTMKKSDPRVALFVAAVCLWPRAPSLMGQPDPVAVRVADHSHVLLLVLIHHACVIPLSWDEAKLPLSHSTDCDAQPSNRSTL